MRVKVKTEYKRCRQGLFVLKNRFFSVPPKLGAKSPSMATRNNHIISMCNQCSGMPHSFIDDRFLCIVHGFSCPARVPLHMVFHEVQGWDPSMHRLHFSIWSPLTACAVLGQLPTLRCLGLIALLGN